MGVTLPMEGQEPAELQCFAAQRRRVARMVHGPIQRTRSSKNSHLRYRNNAFSAKANENLSKTSVSSYLFQKCCVMHYAK